mmetsp:Transcript_16421/g.27826  ORF Transcript_16421/g.27826 Transcript_16421/m.27826 type:complete len:159 (+) Transcript_16421:214-690(+)
MKNYENNSQPHEPNWWEFRLKSKIPERRGYHSSFVYDKKLYIFGGKDIGIGHLNSLWTIDLNELDQFENGVTEYNPNPDWLEVSTTGQKPPPISHHSSIVYQNKMYLFGGSSRDSENLNMYSLDLVKNQWQVVRTHAVNNDKSNNPVSRDEHSCVLWD